MTILAVAILDGNSGASVAEVMSSDDPPTETSLQTPCDDFLSELESERPIADVVADFGFAQNVVVPSPNEVSPTVYCVYRREAGSSNGDVLALVVADERSTAAALVLSRHGQNDSSISGSGWAAILEDHGFGGAPTEFAHGLLSPNWAGGPDANVWNALARARGRG